MRPARTLGAALVAASSLGALTAAPAAAHNVSHSPKVGDSATTFVFRGKLWQPGGEVFAQYYTRTGADRAFKTFRIVVGQNGKFVFRFSRPVSTAAYGLDQRMCFTQFDTRFSPRAAGTPPGRRYRKCKRFYVEPPTARFWPSSGPAGTPFLFVTSGWYPGMRLTLRLTRPDGVVERYTDMDPTRTRGAYFAIGSPFGSVFVRRGATGRLFPGDPNVQVGNYLAAVGAADGSGAQIRTLVTVTQP
jgi:hypothetical protein